MNDEIMYSHMYGHWSGRTFILHHAPTGVMSVVGILSTTGLRKWGIETTGARSPTESG
jgi:hypothetical protein